MSENGRELTLRETVGYYRERRLTDFGASRLTGLGIGPSSTPSNPYFLIETCRECGGTVKVIACIEDPAVIRKILTYLDKQEPRQWAGRLPQGRVPPAGLFG